MTRLLLRLHRIAEMAIPAAIVVLCAIVVSCFVDALLAEQGCVQTGVTRRGEPVFRCKGGGR